VSARLILPPGADEEEWKAERRKGVTASEIAAVLGISPFDSSFNLYFKKRGELDEDFDDDRLALGRALEPYVASRFARDNPDLHLTNPAGLWASAERTWQLATPDGLVHDGPPAGDVFEIAPLAVWEGKSSGTYEEWGEEGSDDIPAYIAAQVLWQMDVIGTELGFVTCFFLSTQRHRTYEITYDEQDIALMRKRGLAFHRAVLAGDVPEIDSHSATAAALRALYPDVDEDETAVVADDLAEHYRRAKASAKAAANEAGLAENRLRAAMGEAKYAVDPHGDKVATRSVYPRKGYTVGPARIDALKPAATKKGKPA
jgi:putative phage-type endonuclease